MIDLVWNFPLLEEQKGMWSRYLRAALEEFEREGVESLRPSFRTEELALRERAAKWLGFAVERTWITCGGHHGTLNALMASGLAGECVAMEGTSYPGFLDQCRATRTEMMACTVDDAGLVPESLREVCKRGSVRGLFTMPTVQNPRGFVTPLERRKEIVEIAREFELTIIEDDAYGFMEEHAPAGYAELAPERTFYVRGLAKSFAPGIRTGFLIAPEGAAAAMVSSLRCTATGTDVPANMAALALCEDGTLERVMRAKREEGAVRNRAARELLGDVCAPGARCAWHLWVTLPEGVDVDTVERACNDAGVIVSNGKWCAVAPGLGRGLRLALGGEVERERALEGVARVAEVLRRFVIG
ncbi:MAG TPA: PLP-dependent aminotransferase family protein [Acidobacteriaceae bacterium]